MASDQQRAVGMPPSALQEGIHFSQTARREPATAAALPGSALHRWEEVTAAGLAALAAAYSATSMSRDRRAPTPLPLLCYGVGDGLLCTFLAQHAPEVP